jgi:hypothetical protein
MSTKTEISSLLPSSPCDQGPDPLPIPPALLEDLTRLLATALLADLQEHPDLSPNVTKLRQCWGVMGAPPPGTAHSQKKARMANTSRAPEDLSMPRRSRLRGRHALPGGVVRGPIENDFGG